MIWPMNYVIAVFILWYNNPILIKIKQKIKQKPYLSSY